MQPITGSLFSQVGSFRKSTKVDMSAQKEVRTVVGENLLLHEKEARSTRINMYSSLLHIGGLRLINLHAQKG